MQLRELGAVTTDPEVYRLRDSRSGIVGGSHKEVGIHVACAHGRTSEVIRNIGGGPLAPCGRPLSIAEEEITVLVG